jgi:hypothetical protein
MARFLLALLALVSIGSAQTPAPTTRPTDPRTLTPDQLKTFHCEAVELMKAEQFLKAAEKLEKVYAAIPPGKRDRALVLNHAITDTAGRSFAMRGVRDLLDYFKDHPEADEPATNVLAVALNVTAENARVKASPLWQSGYREWEKRNRALDVSRAGYHRWGAKWISDVEYNAFEDRRKKVNEEIAAQIDQVDRAASQVNALNQQYNSAREDRERFDYLNGYVDQARTYSAGQLALQSAQGPPDVAAIALSIGAQMQRQIADANLQRQLAAWKAANEARGDLLLAVGNLQAENGRLGRLVGERDKIRPQWPQHADPVDPDARPAPTTQRTTSNVPGSQPATDGDAIPRPSPLDLYSPSGQKH